MKNKFLIFLFIAVSVILFSLSFPPFNHFYFGWFSLVPVIYFSYKYKKFSFVIGFFSGVIFYIFLLNWLFTVSSFFYLLLCVYLAIYWGLFFYISGNFSFNPFVAASIWFFMEILIENLLTGFPWLSFSLSQSTCPYIWKVSQIAGAKGISFLLVFSNFFLFTLISKKLKTISLSLFFFLIIFLGLIFYKPQLKKEGNLKVMLIQPGIITEEVKNVEMPVNILLKMTEKNIKNSKVDIVIWPEGSYSSDIFSNKKILMKIKRMCRKNNVSLIMGTFRKENGKFYNTALFLNKRKIEFYDKMHLVPYGEFIPGGRWGLIKKIFTSYAGYIPEIERGKGIKIFEIKGVKISPLICYENIFSEITNNMVKKGNNVFIVITNDSWFGNSFGPYQHFYQNALRASETGRFFIQCALSGVSGITSEKGKIIKKININKKGIVFFNIPVFSGTTGYVKYGDIPLFILALIITGGYICRRSKK